MFQMYADGYGQKTIAWTLNGNAAQRARAEEDGVQLHALAAFVVVLIPTIVPAVFRCRARAFARRCGLFMK